MNNLLCHPPQVYERLRRVRYGILTENESEWLGKAIIATAGDVYTQLTPPPAEGEDEGVGPAACEWARLPLVLTPPRDPEAERWEEYCVGTGLMRWVPSTWAGVDGLTLELTELGGATLTVWEQSHQVLPHGGTKLAKKDVPVQFKRDEDPDGDLLTTNYIVGWGDWGLTGKDLSINYGPGKLLTRRVKVGRQWVYMDRELKALGKAKAKRTK